MAKIEINLQKVDLNTDAVKLVVIYSIDGETKEYFKTFNLKECGSFKTEDFLPEIVAEKIHFNINFDGYVVLNKVFDGLDLIVTTDNSCCNTSDLKLNSLTVTAKTLDSRHKIQINNHVNLKITDQFNNYANISADHGTIHTEGKINNLHEIFTNNRLDISGKADVINEGIFGTAGKLVYQGHSIVNTGVMAAKDAKITLTKRHTTDDDKILFTNNKLFMITNNLSFESERNFINTGDLIVGSQAKFKLSGLYNKGRIAVNSKCFIDAKTHIINKQQGSIVSGERLRLSFRSKVGKLINLGILTADKMAIRNCFDFVNDVNATLLTRELELLAVSSFFNAGIICGKQKCDLVLLTVDSAKAINTSNGVITSDQKINLVVKDNFNNYGKITGHTGIKGTFFGSLFNLSKGVISSEALLSLKTITELINTSEISGAQTDIFAKIVNNQQSGYIYGTELLKLNGTFIENAGKLYSKEQINIDVKVLIENLRSGIIQSAKNVAVTAGLKLSNSGLLQTTEYFDCSVTDGLVTNHKNGTIIAQKGTIDSHGVTNAGNIKINNLHTKSHWLFNSGEMNVNLLKTTIQGIFRNLQQGLIQVDTLAQIITKNNFDNLGVLLGDQKIEIIGKEICNYIGGELQAQHYLYLNAVNLFIKGEVSSAGDLFLIVKENFEYENVNLKANGELLLTLRDGSQVKYDINTPGDLKFEFLTKEGTWYNNAQLTSGKDLLIDLPGYIIVNGQFNDKALIQAKNLLTIRAKQLEVTTGALITKELDLHTKHHIIVGLDGSIVGINGKLHAEEGNIEQQGSIEFLKNLAILAKKAYSHKDSTTLIGGDLEVIVDQLILEGFTKVDGNFDAKVIDFHLSQYANTLQVPVIYNGSVGQVSVDIQQADPNTGVLQAKKIIINCEQFTQIGGTIRSGSGGTYIEIKGDAFLEGLRTTHIWQGAISALGRNYAIVPVFVPATIASDGDLKVTAGGKLVGASIELKAVGVKEVTAKKGVNITEKYEHYDPPEYIEDDDDDDDWFGSLFSVAISAVASCFIGPAACGVFGMTAGATATLITSSAISGATQAALNGGKFKDILKSATIGAITAGVMDKIKIATPALAAESTKRIVAAKNGILNSTIQTGAKIAVNGKGKIDVASFLASGTAVFSGVTINSELGKNLTESGIKATVSTAAHGGQVIQNLATSMVEASCSHLGKTAGDEFATNLYIHRQQEVAARKNLSKQRVAESKQNKKEQDKVSSSKLRVNDQIQVTNQSSSNTTSLLQSDELAAAHRQANNIRWLKKLEMFSGGLDHFISQEQASSSWSNNDFDLESMLYRSQSKVMLHAYQKYQIGTRAMGAMQSGFGIGQLGLSVALAETGVGVMPACFLAARGADNLVTGAIGFVTGQDMPTVLHQAIRRVGLSDTTAMLVELGADLSPAVPTMARNAVDLYKTGVLKLYDVTRAKNLKWFEPKYVSTGGFRNELPLGCARNNFRISSQLESSIFTPAFDEISYFSTKSYLDGTLYPTEKLPTLVKYLEKRGVHVYEAIKDPCFIARREGINHIYFTKNPTVLEVKHELSHWLDYQKLGYEKYSKLSRFEREQLVLERLQKNRVWDDLNNFEKDFAIRYVEKLKPKTTTPALGVKND